MSDMTIGRATPAVEQAQPSTRAWVSALPGVLFFVTFVVGFMLLTFLTFFPAILVLIWVVVVSVVMARRPGAASGGR